MPKAVIIWETRTGATSSIAMEIKDVLQQAGITVIAKRMSNAQDEGFNVCGEMAGADAIVIGSPTYNRDMIPQVKDLLTQMEKAGLKGKIGAAFGSCGWSGESVQLITDALKNGCNLTVIEPGLKIINRPSGKSLEECQQFAKSIADKIKK
jgi:flavodoxin I